MRKIKERSFWFILSGLILTVLFRLRDFILQRNRNYPRLEERLDEQQIKRLTIILNGVNFIKVIIVLLICGYFIYRLIKNLKEEQGQKYITILFGINIIGLIFGITGLLRGNYSSFIGVIISTLILVGCYMQQYQLDE